MDQTGPTSISTATIKYSWYCYYTQQAEQFGRFRKWNHFTVTLKPGEDKSYATSQNSNI